MFKSPEEQAQCFYETCVLLMVTDKTRKAAVQEVPHTHTSMHAFYNHLSVNDLILNCEIANKEKRKTWREDASSWRRSEILSNEICESEKDREGINSGAKFKMQ